MIEIQHERALTSPQIDGVIVEAFREAEHTSGTEHLIVKALRRRGMLTVSLTAEEDGLVVGYVAISPVTITDGAAGWYGLGPVAVVPERQGEGIGALLIRRALDELKKLDAAGCVVLGEPSYYGRFGFRAEPALVLPEIPPEYFQATSFTGAIPAGTVRYDEAFETLD